MDARPLLIGFLLFVTLFVLMTWFLQLSYNYIAPVIVKSVTPTFNVDDDFTALTFGQSVVFAIFISVVLGGPLLSGSQIPQSPSKKSKK